MPLTPTDVANKQFRIAFRGYSLDEVDAFLDEVETELSRLLRDNSEMKGRPAAAPTATAVPSAAPEPLAGMEGQEAALRTLLLAQRTADEAIAEATAEAEQIRSGARTEAEATLRDARDEAQSTLASARSEADSAVTKARTEAESAVTSARTEADRALGSARSEAESTLAAARSRAARLDEEVAQRIQTATGDLDAQRRALEARIEELRAFEREYRTRLKAYLETQLRDLDSRTGSDDGGAGVPAGARSAAVGSPPAGAVGARTRGGTPAPVAPPRTAPEPTEQGTPAGPPREAPMAGLRSVPHLSSSPDPEPVGPFTADPRGRQAEGEGEPPAPR